MIVETKKRSILKAVTWRITATLTTVTLVYIFFGRLELAAAVGGLEVILKLLFYYLHERGWGLISFGRKRVDPFVLWFTGLPLSGKTTIADKVFQMLPAEQLDVERIDSHDVRELFPEVGFTREERLLHLKRVSHLVRKLEKNNVSVVASFVTPYREAREEIKRMINDNYIEIYVKASVETCKKRDDRGIYARAESGDIPNFTGVSDVYEEPENPHLTLDTEAFSADQCATKVLDYVNRHLIS